MKRLVRGVIIAALVTAPALAAMRVGPEQEAPDDRMTRAPYQQDQPALAFDGKNFLTVWVDDRSASVHELYASRISPLGQVLDPLGIRITEWPRTIGSFDVAFGRSTFLVLDSSLTATEIDTSGSIVSRQSPLAAQGFGDHPQLCWTGSNYVAAWVSDAMVAALLDESGRLIAGPITLSPYGAVQDIATNGDRSIVLFNRGAALYDVAMMRDGALVGPEVLLDQRNAVGVTRNTAHVASDGHNFFVTWIDSFAHTVKAQRVDPSGEPIGSTDVLAGQTSAGIPALPNITWTGSEYLVAWYRSNLALDPGNLETLRLDSSGTHLSQPAVDFVSTERGLEDFSLLAAGGTTEFVGAFGHRTTDAEQEIFEKRIGMPDELHLVSGGRPAAVRPSIATSHSQAFAVWEESRGSTLAQRDPVAMGSLWSPDGSPLSEPFDIDPSNGSQMEPLVSAGANTFLVQWHDYTSNKYRVFDNRGVAVTATGQLDATGPYGAVGRAARAAWTGDAYAIVRSSPTAIDVITIDENGRTSQPSQPLPLTTTLGPAPAAMACNRTICVAAVVNSVPVTVYYAKPEIRVARFTLAGSLIDSQSTLISTNASGDGVAITTLGNDFVVTWAANDGIHAARVNSDSLAIDETLVAAGRVTQLPAHAAIATIANEAVITWVDDHRDIAAATVEESPISGQLVATSQLVISADPKAEQNPDITSAGDHALVTYDRLSSERGVPTVFVRRITIDGRRRAVQH